MQLLISAGGTSLARAAVVLCPFFRRAIGVQLWRPTFQVYLPGLHGRLSLDGASSERIVAAQGTWDWDDGASMARQGYSSRVSVM